MNYLRTFIQTIRHPLSINFATTFTKIALWKINQLTLRLPTIVVLGNGNKCICYPDSSYGGMVVYTTYPDYEVVQGIKKYLPVSGTFFDIGANIGLMTLVAAGIKNTRVHSFEPSPVAYPRLFENINLNNLSSRVLIHQIAVSDKGGWINFNDDERSELSHISTKNEDGQKIKTTTIDSYCQKNSINKIDVLKIDVEGAELSVLKGAKQMLELGKIKHIYCELNCASINYGSSNSETLKYLESLGYRHAKVPKNIDKIIINLHAWKNR